MTRWILRVWAAALLLPLAAYALLGWFSRYASDDYCTASITLTLGFVQAQRYWYDNWSGRFSFTAFVSALELIGNWVVPIMPAIALVVWLTVTTWACLPIANLSGWRFPRLASFVVAELLIFGTLVSAPNIGQSFYMQAGLATYTLPLILITLYAGWAMRTVIAADAHGLSAGMIAISGVALLLIGGLSETTATVYTACLGLAGGLGLLLLRGAQRRVLLGLVSAGIVGSLLATFLMGVAPGTAQRLAQEGDPGFSLSRVPLAWGASVDLAVSIARRFEALSRPTFVFQFLVPVGVGWLVAGSPDRRRVRMALRNALLAVLISALGVALMALSLFPSYVIQGFDPPARIQQITDFALMLALATAGYLIGDGLAHLTQNTRRLPMAHLGVVVAVALLAVVPVSESLDIFGQVPVEAAYAADWDRVDRFLRSAQPDANGVVTAAPLPPRWDWAFLDEGPHDFPNVCIARYYGLPAVVANGPAPVWTGASEPGGREPGADDGR